MTRPRPASAHDARMLRLEVEERTELLRTSPVLAGLRAGLAAKGLVPEELLLAGFMESEDGREWGAIVTPDGRVFEYKRRTNDRAKANFTQWTRRAGLHLARLVRDALPAIPFALDLVEGPAVEAGKRRSTTPKSTKRPR